LLLVFEANLWAWDWLRWRGLRDDGSRKAQAFFEKWPDDGMKRIWKRSVSLVFSGVSVPDGRVF
jgi:hypothetical protein|tara:strand:- start:908 stop:1099 length:192 start_codon:yes stop_codon:yes gene_type:complete